MMWNGLMKKVVKKLKEKETLVLGVIIGLSIGIAICKIPWHKYDYNYFGSIAEWVGSLGAIISLFFVYVQIKEAKDEYSRQHTPRIKIEGVLSTGWIKSKRKGGSRWYPSGYLDLQIWAVNVSEAAGSYRYVGLCKDKDYEKVKNSGFYSQGLILNDYTFPFHEPVIEFKNYNNFEKLEEKTVSKIQTINGKSLVDFLFDESNKKEQVVPVCIIYVDAFNNPIVRKFKLRLNGKKLSMTK